jgi:DNA-binding NarL/FixJ family response regulator
LLGNAPASSFSDTAVADPGTHLTERQTEVLRLLAAGKPNKLICRELQMSEGTVKAHINAIYRSMGVANRTEAALAAQRLRLLQ